MVFCETNWTVPFFRNSVVCLSLSVEKNGVLRVCLIQRHPLHQTRSQRYRSVDRHYTVSSTCCIGAATTFSHVNFKFCCGLYRVQTSVQKGFPRVDVCAVQTTWESVPKPFPNCYQIAFHPFYSLSVYFLFSFFCKDKLYNDWNINHGRCTRTGNPRKNEIQPNQPTDVLHFSGHLETLGKKNLPLVSYFEFVQHEFFLHDLLRVEGLTTDICFFLLPFSTLLLPRKSMFSGGNCSYTRLVQYTIQREVGNQRNYCLAWRSNISLNWRADKRADSGEQPGSRRQRKYF